MMMTPHIKKTRTVSHMTSLPEYIKRQKQAQKQQEIKTARREEFHFIRQVCGTAPKFNFFASGGNHVK